MRSLIATLLLFIASPALAFQGMGPGPGVNGHASEEPPAGISDDFSGTLANWTVESGTGTWAISSGQLALTSTSDVELHARHNSQTSTSDQFIEMTVVSRNTSGELAMLFRCSSSMTCDQISIGTYGNSLAHGGVVNGNWSAGYENKNHNIADGSVIKCVMSGAGASKRIYCYDDGVLIDGGSGYTFGGANGLDSGSYVGVYGISGGSGSTVIDNFRAGDGTGE